MPNRFTEGEITSLVRRFFRANDFNFLSTFSNGDKLYYTFDGNTLNNKQPDSIIFKNDLVIICEDKIMFRSLYNANDKTKGDFSKLSRFLNSSIDLNIFKKKIKNLVNIENVKIIGCLSSLESKQESNNKSFISDNLMHLSIIESKAKTYKITANIVEELHHYFTNQTIEFVI